MPNLVGIWNPVLSEHSVEDLLSRQLHRVRAPNISYNEYSFISHGFGMALQDHGIFANGIQPIKTANGQFSLLLDGELYNFDELKWKFRNDLCGGDISAPDMCLQLIGKFGHRIVDLFNGLFCVVLYDRLNQRVTLISDRFGFRPLFYVYNGKALIFGSELKALSVVDPSHRRLDELGTLEFFCYGTHFNNRTWMSGYLRLPPATIMNVDEDGVRSRTYWHYRYNERANVLEQGTYSQLFGIHLDRAVERCMKGSRRIGIFLSGGYDSRSLAAAIRKYRLPVPAFTFGHPESRDVRYAALLADRIGLEHYLLTDPGPYLYSNCREIVWRTEGMSSFANCTSIRYHALLKDKIDIILLGFLGEFSGSHVWPQLLLARSRRAVVKTIYSRMVLRRLESVRRIFNASRFAQILDELRGRFEASFENIQNDHPINIADSWNFLYIQPQSSFQSASVDRYQFEARAPHMDRELVDFLLSIPPYSRLEQRVYKRMIANSFPNIRDVPCVNSGLPIEPRFVREYSRMAVRYVRAHTAQRFGKLFGRTESMGREFRDLGAEFRRERSLIDKILLPLMEGGIFQANIFNCSGIKEMINEHYDGKKNHQGALSLLISWGLAVKYFLHDDFSDVREDLHVARKAPSMAQQSDLG
jgi:asparagine synthetase B (glutamine-hydrolysing)